MRSSPLRNRLAAANANFGERYSTEVALHCAPRAEEYRAVRDTAAVTDFSFTRRFRVRQEQGLDFLDQLLAGNVARIRYGRVLHTFLADADGHLAADCYVANNDEDFLVILEPIIPDDALDALLAAAGANAAGLEDLTASHALLSLDGFKAWEVARKLFGADILGLPYLSIETCPFADESVRLFRAGKTSEFGYLLQAPAALAEPLFDALLREVTAVGGRCCGVQIHDELRLEGRFFNIHAEGLRVRDPLVLGLQWMIDFEKPEFIGSEPIRQRRASGLREKVVGVAAPANHAALALGDSLVLEGQAVGRIVATCHSDVLGRPLGLAMLPVGLAYAGLTFELGARGGPLLETISMPPIMPRSLTVKLDEL
jgi:aminomethyltransferase